MGDPSKLTTEIARGRRNRRFHSPCYQHWKIDLVSRTVERPYHLDWLCGWGAQGVGILRGSHSFHAVMMEEEGLLVDLRESQRGELASGDQRGHSLLSSPFLAVRLGTLELRGPAPSSSVTEHIH
jgi:hypothetical protein